jgi:hypothetical protein
MKKVFAVLVSFCFTISLQAQAVDSVINLFVEANGGKEKLNAINTLQMQSTLNLQPMGLSTTVTTVREKNKLFRIQTPVPMGGGDSYTLITDTIGYSYLPPMRMGDNGFEGQKTQITGDNLIKQQYLTDCAGLFAQLVDYTAKGHMAELAGTEKVNGKDCDKIKLKLKTGQELLYFIDKNNGQVKRMQLPIPVALEIVGMGGMMSMMGGARNYANQKIDIYFSDYRLFGDLPFPSKQKFDLGMMSVEFENTSITINKPIEEKWYKVN